MTSRKLAAVLLIAGAIPCGMVTGATPPPVHETVSPQFKHELPNIPGKTFTTLIVNYPPGARSVPHRHGNAFVYAYVLSGAVRSQVDDAPLKTYRTGEYWFEPPGARHKVSENASSTEPASLLVVFVANTGEPLKTLD